jgi:hypothetical protein
VWLPSSNETKALCARVCPGGWLFNVHFCLIPGDKGYLMSSVSCGMRPADSGTCRLHMPVPLEIDGDFNFDALVTADYNPEHAVVMECAEPISLSQEDLTALSQLTEAGYVLHYDSTLTDPSRELSCFRVSVLLRSGGVPTDAFYFLPEDLQRRLQNHMAFSHCATYRVQMYISLSGVWAAIALHKDLLTWLAQGRCVHPIAADLDDEYGSNEGREGSAGEGRQRAPAYQHTR